MSTRSGRSRHAGAAQSGAGPVDDRCTSAGNSRRMPAVPLSPSIRATRVRPAGDGAFDLPGIVAALRTAGWTGPWGVEILSDEHRSLPVRLAADSARRLLE